MSMYKCKHYKQENTIDILYTLDSASNYSAIKKLKPWLQSQVVQSHEMREDSYISYFLNRELKY
jgi:hypothetical protein